MKISRQAIKALRYLISHGLIIRKFKIVVYEDPYAEDDFLRIHTKLLNALNMFTKLLEKLKLSDGCIYNIFDQFVKEEVARRQWVIMEREGRAHGRYFRWSRRLSRIYQLPYLVLHADKIASERDTSPETHVLTRSGLTVNRDQSEATK